MDEIVFPDLQEEPSGERGTDERQDSEEAVKDSEEWTASLESRTESERQLDGGQERWRDEDGSLADDEDDGDDNDDDDDDDGPRMSFSPLVTVVRKTAEKQTERCDVRDGDVTTPWGNTKQSPQSRSSCCGELMRSVLSLVAGAVLFPLLVWGGHDLLPLHLPEVSGAPSRLVYTLRCALFATFPIILGVLVHGISRLKFSSLTPLVEGRRVSRHTLVHITFVHDSLRLLLLFFLQLAVMATYIHPPALKLVPLLTIVFVFGRLIYWPSVCFSSSVRALGFSLSFLPVLALMGFNLYSICSSTGDGVVFEVAPPTTAPPPKPRWWG
ncbi:transmembrane protein 79 isoform 1-T3 [Clarias gariepinus]|uniref:transmembrane protein 79 n=1 Tax=Clarias gariepinus TaxID=13013 RepID=UPI00234CE5D8|nr:transmembrane protein 79 [Clarias gariepinus]